MESSSVVAPTGNELLQSGEGSLQATYDTDGKIVFVSSKAESERFPPVCGGSVGLNHLVGPNLTRRICIVQEYDRRPGAVNKTTFVGENRSIVMLRLFSGLHVWEWDISVDIKYIADPTMLTIPVVTPPQTASADTGSIRRTQILEFLLQLAEAGNFHSYLTLDVVYKIELEVHKKPIASSVFRSTWLRGLRELRYRFWVSQVVNFRRSAAVWGPQAIKYAGITMLVALGDGLSRLDRVFKIADGNDKQGVLTNPRVRLLLKKGHFCCRSRCAFRYELCGEAPLPEMDGKKTKLKAPKIQHLITPVVQERKRRRLDVKKLRARSDRSIPYEPDNLYIVPTKLAEAPNGGVAIARSHEVQLIDVANRKVVLRDGTGINNLCKKPSVDLRSDPGIADKTIDCLGLGILPEVDPTVRICDGCAERVDAQHAFRTRDLHNNSYVENGLEDKEDEDVCRFCLKADGGAALVELFPGGGGSVADEVQTVRDCLGVEINSWDKLTKICGDCMGGVEELAEFSPTAVPVKLEDVTDCRIRTALAIWPCGTGDNPAWNWEFRFLIIGIKEKPSKLVQIG
ncbi:hypothetical protein quinque_014036 [Culex quinquefasciatus]